MIVLKILLYILLAVLALILVVLITPAGGEFSYIDGKFRYKVKLWIIDLMDSDGGGLYGWWKKRKANKKNKPAKPKKEKKPKPVKDKKSKKKKKQREKYEWEKELDEIPVNDPEAEMPPAVKEDTESGSHSSAEEGFSSEADVHTEEASGKADKKKKKNGSDDEPFENDDNDEDNEKDEDKKDLSEKIEFVVGIWESAQRPMLKIFKGFKLKDFYIDFIIADEDAYDCALKYGKYSTLIFNGIAFFSQLITVRLKTVDVRPAFGLSKGRWDTSGKVSFRLGTVVIAGAWFLLTYIFRTFIPEKLRKRKLKKSAARQK